MAASKVYLCGPIDQVDGEQASVWRKLVSCRLAELGAQVLLWDPYLEGQRYRNNPRLVHERNLQALSLSDLVLVCYLRGQQSVGTWEEVGLAVHLNIPILLATDDPEAFSYLLAGASNECCSPEPFLMAAEVYAWSKSHQLNRPYQPELLMEWTNDWAVPHRPHADDCGIDLPAAQDVTVPEDGSVDVPLGVKVAIPPGYYGRLIGRSSTFARRGLLVVEGVIDSGYRGELFAQVILAPGAKGPIRIDQGERVCQLIVQPYASLVYRPVQELPPGSRGGRGFGSSGT